MVFNTKCIYTLDNVLESENKFARNDTIVNSSNYISTNEKLCKEFNEYGVGIENMEVFSILSVAKSLKFSCWNICNNKLYKWKCHEDFIKNHKEAMEN